MDGSLQEYHWSLGGGTTGYSYVDMVENLPATLWDGVPAAPYSSKKTYL